jgi:hypothetical protein
MPKFGNKDPENITKRLVLARIHSLFDPLGILAPILVKAKLFYQKLCEEKIKWDESLNFEKESEWKLIEEEWKSIEFKFPRYIQKEKKTRYEIHTFVDASKFPTLVRHISKL